MFNKELIEKLREIKTPFYYYNLDLLKDTLKQVSIEADKYKYHVHYALKANSNVEILHIIRSFGLGADCVSGNEVKRALECGFSNKQIAFAGVGKTDDEIHIGLENDIFSFNCESIQEMEVINQLAKHSNKIANIAIRINPNVEANTHKYITTGTSDNKFGINLSDLNTVLDSIKQLKNINLIGLHFHIGSQITDLNVFKNLAEKVNEIQQQVISKGFSLPTLNLGGGLGIDYYNPEVNTVAPFRDFFETIHTYLKPLKNQKVHFELGRALVAQCGFLITKVLYTKLNGQTNFAIVDAGFTELIRPALYNSYHKIENLDNNSDFSDYDVVGPICESSDFFGKQISLGKAERGNLLAIYSTGAYGQIMSSQYNLRNLVQTVYSDHI